jgi:hypothetical protein
MNAAMIAAAGKRRESGVLEHYQNCHFVCAKGMRIALAESYLDAQVHLLTLHGDLFDPWPKVEAVLQTA